jgi:hypothetical protein
MRRDSEYSRAEKHIPGAVDRKMDTGGGVRFDLPGRAGVAAGVQSGNGCRLASTPSSALLLHGTMFAVAY